MKRSKNWKATLSIGCAGAALLGCGMIEQAEVDVDEPAATLRVVHSVPDAPAVDIYIAGSETPAISALEPGQATATIAVDLDTYEFEIRPAGAAASTVPLLTTDAITFAEGDSITMVAVGLLDSSGNNDQLRVLTFADTFETPSTDSATVRLIHAAPDAPTVALDIGDDGTIEYENIERFGTSSESGAQLRAETEHQLAIYAGHPLARVTSFTLPPLARGSQLFMVATGKLAAEARADDGFSVLVLPPEGKDVDVTRVRQNPVVYVVHAGADAPAVDLRAGGAPLALGLSFGQLSASIQLPPGSYDIEIAPAGSAGAVASSHTPELVAGDEVIAVATGLLAPAAGEAPFEVLYFASEFALDDPHSARLRAIHASPDAPAVDISPLAVSGNLGTPLLESGISFGEGSVSEGRSVPVAALRVGVAAAGSPSPVAAFDITTAPSERAYVIAAGALGGGAGRAPFQLLAVDTSATPWSIASVSPVATH